MAHSSDQFQTQRDVALQDSANKLPAAKRDALLTQAILQRYSKDRPREVVDDIAATERTFCRCLAGRLATVTATTTPTFSRKTIRRCG